jgi:hypothetical protein
MTDPTGLSFLCYKRERSREAELLIRAQHDHGIPTWQDVKNLEHKHTATQLREVLDDSNTANALLWLTPEVAVSETIKQIEAPAIFRRARNRDSFFVIPVAAGSLGYSEAADVLGPTFSTEDLREWNVYKVNEDPIIPTEAARIAASLLNKRISAIHNSMPAGEPLRIKLYTRVDPPSISGTSLLINWTPRFENIQAKPGAWEGYLLPALKAISGAIQAKSPGRPIEATGLCSLPAATALGCVFVQTLGLKVTWEQRMPDGNHQMWSLEAGREDSGFRAKVTDRNLSAKDIAVLVSVSDNVEPAFTATFGSPVPFRSIIEVSKPGGLRHEVSSPEQAKDISYVVQEAIRQVRAEVRQVSRFHLFMAVPVGLAMLIGQLLNTLGSVQTYQHIPDEGQYRPAVLLYPSL